MHNRVRKLFQPGQHFGRCLSVLAYSFTCSPIMGLCMGSTTCISGCQMPSKQVSKSTQYAESTPSKIS